jgi:hypothetical protein
MKTMSVFLNTMTTCWSLFMLSGGKYFNTFYNLFYSNSGHCIQLKPHIVAAAKALRELNPPVYVAIVEAS